MDVCSEHAKLSRDVALLKQDIDHIKEGQSTNNEMTLKILDAVKGNGRKGLCTEVELQKSSLKKAWWWLGGVSLAIICMLGRLFV